MPDVSGALRAVSRCGPGGCAPSRVSRGFGQVPGRDGSYRATVEGCLSCGAQAGAAVGPSGYRARLSGPGLRVEENGSPGDRGAALAAMRDAAATQRRSAVRISQGWVRPTDVATETPTRSAVPPVTTRRGR